MTALPAGLAAFDLTGRTALVTGSSQGIGKTLAAGLAGAGATVVVHGRDAAKAHASAREISRTTGADVHSVVFDVTDAAAVDEGMNAVERLVGAPDILVNNAGVQRRAPIAEFADEDWDALVQTNLSSVFHLSRRVSAGMIARGSGKIIQIGSVQSQLARPSIAAYAATKGAIVMFTKGLCADLAPHGIQANAIAPGTSPPSSRRRSSPTSSSRTGCADGPPPVGGETPRISSALCCSLRAPRATSSTGRRCSSTAA